MAGQIPLPPPKKKFVEISNLSDQICFVQFVKSCSQKFLNCDLISDLIAEKNVQPSAMLEKFTIRMDKMFYFVMCCPIYKYVFPMCWTVFPILLSNIDLQLFT